MLKMNGQGERKEKIKPASEVGARLAGLWKKTGARIVNAAKALDPSLPEGAALGRTAIVGARPFGFALLAAAPRDVPLIAVGLLLSALTVGGSDGIMLASVCLFTVALRLAVRALIDPPRDGGISASAFGENVYLRMASASVSAFAAGLWRLIAGGFYFYDLRGAIISMLLAPAAAGIFEPVFRRGDFYPDGTAEIPPVTRKRKRERKRAKGGAAAVAARRL